MMGQQILKQDGQVLLGRLVSSNEDELSIMLVGNSVVTVPRDEIKETRDVGNSLMYEGLLTGMTDDQVNTLLDYLISLGQ
jgi:putative heme-binding domain-containing protein